MRIVAYRTSWNATDNIGSIRFFQENGQWSNWVNYQDINEYQVILMILQNERPVFHTKTPNGKDLFYTNNEDTGVQD